MLGSEVQLAVVKGSGVQRSVVQRSGVERGVWLGVSCQKSNGQRCSG